MSCTFVPPYLLRHLASRAAEPPAAPSRTLQVDARLRGLRSSPPRALPTLRAPAAAAAADQSRRVVHTAAGTEQLPGTVARTDGDPPEGGVGPLPSLQVQSTAGRDLEVRSRD